MAKQPEEIAVSVCRNKLLTLIDTLPSQGITLTRRGRAVARLLPVRETNADLIGSVPGLVNDPSDDLLETGISWEAHRKLRPRRGARRSGTR